MNEMEEFFEKQLQAKDDLIATQKYTIELLIFNTQLMQEKIEKQQKIIEKREMQMYQSMMDKEE